MKLTSGGWAESKNIGNHSLTNTHPFVFILHTGNCVWFFLFVVKLFIFPCVLLGSLTYECGIFASHWDNYRGCGKNFTKSPKESLLWPHLLLTIPRPCQGWLLALCVHPWVNHWHMLGVLRPVQVQRLEHVGREEWMPLWWRCQSSFPYTHPFLRESGFL